MNELYKSKKLEETKLQRLKRRWLGVWVKTGHDFFVINDYRGTYYAEAESEKPKLKRWTK